jgi:hypothetical protein
MQQNYDRETKILNYVAIAITSTWQISDRISQKQK